MPKPGTRIKRAGARRRRALTGKLHGIGHRPRQRNVYQACLMRVSDF